MPRAEVRRALSDTLRSSLSCPQQPDPLGLQLRLAQSAAVQFRSRHKTDTGSYALACRCLSVQPQAWKEIKQFWCSPHTPCHTRPAVCMEAGQGQSLAQSRG